FAGGTLTAVRTVSLRVLVQALLVALELPPGDVTGVGVGQQRLPLFRWEMSATGVAVLSPAAAGAGGEGGGRRTGGVGQGPGPRPVVPRPVRPGVRRGVAAGGTTGLAPGNP